jgi:hypothetical protein
LARLSSLPVLSPAVVVSVSVSEAAVVSLHTDPNAAARIFRVDDDEAMVVGRRNLNLAAVEPKIREAILEFWFSSSVLWRELASLNELTD